MLACVGCGEFGGCGNAFQADSVLLPLMGCFREGYKGVTCFVISGFICYIVSGSSSDMLQDAFYTRKIETTSLLLLFIFFFWACVIW